MESFVESSLLNIIHGNSYILNNILSLRAAEARDKPLICCCYQHHLDIEDFMRKDTYGRQLGCKYVFFY